MDSNMKNMRILQELKDTFSQTFDFVHQELNFHSIKGHLLYLRNICDSELIRKQLIIPLYESQSQEDYASYIHSMPNCDTYQTMDLAIKNIWEGSVVLFWESNLWSIHSKGFEFKQISDSTMEPAIMGPNDGLTENLSTNIRMVRQRFLKQALQVEDMQLGSNNKFPAALLFDQQSVNKEALAKVKERLKQLDCRSLTRIDQLQKLLTPQKASVFPTVLMTGRPDRIIKSLQDGKIVLLVEGTTLAYILPSFFLDFISAMDDLYHLPVIGNFLLFIRLLGIGVAAFLPAFYIAVTAYLPEFFRIELALSFAGNRMIIPYPSFVEALFLMFMMELLTEASARLPKSVGAAGTTVGGLILGQAASQAGIVSDTVVIIVSGIAIANFVIPMSSMSYAIRVIKYGMFILTVLFGLLGFVVGLIGLIFHLTQLPNYGVPYLKLIPDKKIG